MNKYKQRAEEQLSLLEKYYNNDNFKGANDLWDNTLQRYTERQFSNNVKSIEQIDYALYSMPRQYETGVFFYFTKEDLKDKKTRKRILKLLTYLYKHEIGLKRKECPPKYAVVQSDRDLRNISEIMKNM